MGEASIIGWRWMRSARHAVREALRTQPLRLAAAVAVISGVWALLCGLFFSLLGFLGQEAYAAIKPRLVESLLALLLLALGALVTLSHTLLTWAALFRTRSAHFHAALPLSERALFWQAAVGSALWSGWAVLILGVPLLIALAREALRPLLFVPAAALAFLAFLGCCLALGTLLALLLARLIPLLRRGLRGIVIAVALAAVVVSALAITGAERTREPLTFMSEVIARLRFVEHPLLPSWWAQQALSAALAERWREWGWYAALLAANAGGILVLAEWLAVRRFRRALDALSNRPERPNARPLSRPWRPLPFLPADLALLVAKDLRLFRRDPAQVLQFTVFFGLLAFYLAMLPRIGRAFAFDDWWRPAVSLLNLTAIAMALATFTGRFVYPLLSLEGRRLWVLALAPWPRARIVVGKLVFALVVGIPVSVALAVLSGAMLELPARLIVYQAAVIAAMAVGLAASALGLGARYADYRAEDPNRLVAGYGGTINLFASLLFVALLLTGAALPIIGRDTAAAWVAGILWSGGIAVLWSVFFYRLAQRWFARLEDRELRAGSALEGALVR
ncbi:MAG: hypothetical protein RMM29_06280 [Planctomycetota bacterium]|nr:hypothetical protein [Planctomycetota bacterium]MCX8039737.1 hypothetical protein [Planctomycetota bacterium]MDW8373237.1 hypothetical protein [Planctomycetota bacterium]